MQALRTGTARVRFLLQDDFHAQVLCFVGEFEAHRTCRPLVNFLVVRVTNIGGLPKIAHIANDQRSHACLVQRGDQFACLLVLNLSNLVFDLLQLFLFRADDALAPLGGSDPPRGDDGRQHRGPLNQVDEIVHGRDGQARGPGGRGTTGARPTRGDAPGLYIGDVHTTPRVRGHR